MSELVIDTRGSRLSARQTQQIVDHINFTWKLAGCGMCQGKQFDLLSMVMPRFVATLEMVIDMTATQRPCAALICTTCGDVRVVDLNVIGVFDVPDDAAPAEGPYR